MYPYELDITENQTKQPETHTHTQGRSTDPAFLWMGWVKIILIDNILDFQNKLGLTKGNFHLSILSDPVVRMFISRPYIGFFFIICMACFIVPGAVLTRGLVLLQCGSVW